MPKPTQFITVTFSSFWSSGELTMKKARALPFAKSLHDNHIAFKRQVSWNGKYRGIEIDDDTEKLKVSFTPVLKVFDRKTKTYKDYLENK